MSVCVGLYVIDVSSDLERDCVPRVADMLVVVLTSLVLDSDPDLVKVTDDDLLALSSNVDVKDRDTSNVSDDVTDADPDGEGEGVTVGSSVSESELVHDGEMEVDSDGDGSIDNDNVVERDAVELRPSLEEVTEPDAENVALMALLLTSAVAVGVPLMESDGVADSIVPDVMSEGVTEAVREALLSVESVIDVDSVRDSVMDKLFDIVTSLVVVSDCDVLLEGVEVRLWLVVTDLTSESLGESEYDDVGVALLHVRVLVSLAMADDVMLGELSSVGVPVGVAVGVSRSTNDAVAFNVREWLGVSSSVADAFVLDLDTVREGVTEIESDCVLESVGVHWSDSVTEALPLDENVCGRVTVQVASKEMDGEGVLVVDGVVEAEVFRELDADLLGDISSDEESDSVHDAVVDFDSDNSRDCVRDTDNVRD